MKENKEELTLTPQTPFSSLPQIAHAIAVQKGWWEGGKREKGELVNLIMSEWAEALEALRGDNIKNERCWELGMVLSWDDGFFDEYFKTEFKGKFITELSDIIIRIFDWMGSKGIEFEFNGEFPAHRYYYPDLCDLSKTENKDKNIQQKMSRLRDLINTLDHPQRNPNHSPHLYHKILPIIWLCEDLAKGFGCRLKDYILVKMKRNLSRPYKHGGKKF